jgi:hypothetical protein
MVGMSDFVLIDLFNQRDAVCSHVQGWQPEAILNWMMQFGVVSNHPTSSDVYVFCSHVDRNRTLFSFNENGELEISVSGTAWIT